MSKYPSPTIRPIPAKPLAYFLAYLLAYLHTCLFTYLHHPTPQSPSPY